MAEALSPNSIGSKVPRMCRHQNGSTVHDIATASHAPAATTGAATIRFTRQPTMNPMTECATHRSMPIKSGGRLWSVGMERSWAKPRTTGKSKRDQATPTAGHNTWAAIRYCERAGANCHISASRSRPLSQAPRAMAVA